MKYHRILAAVAGTPWAIEPAKGAAILHFLAFAASGGRHEPGHVATLAAERQPAPAEAGVAVIPIHGTIMPRASSDMEGSGVISAETIAARVGQAASDSRVGGIVLDVDSYGGNAQGVREAAASIASAAAAKPLVAVANHAAASAAYWLASAAGELAVTPSGEVGSIGVLTMHEDLTRALEAAGIKQTLIRSTQSPHKAETYPQSPLSDESRAFLQARVDATAERFIAAVAEGRGVTRERVLADFGGGRMLDAEAALAVGMVDRISTLEGEIAAMAQRIAAGSRPSGLANRRRAMAFR
jgi:signal peptide peptidase SppA